MEHHSKWKKTHIDSRLSWTKEHMSWISDWTFVMDSDKKKLNLDSPNANIACSVERMQMNFIQLNKWGKEL